MADTSGRVRLRDVRSDQPIGTALPTPGDPVLAVAFSADDSAVHTAGTRTRPQSHPVAPEWGAARVCERVGTGLSRADWEALVPGAP